MPHIHDKIDYTAEAFVVHKGKVLMRKHEKYHKWLAVGGHVELDEDPNQAVIREVKEEVGLDVHLIDTRLFKEESGHGQDLIPPMGMNRHRISDTHEHIVLYFAAVSDSDEVIPESPDDEWKWRSADEIENLEGIYPDIVFYAKRDIQLAEES